MKKKIIIDNFRCTGCGLCELACSFWKTGEFQPSMSRITVDNYARIGISKPNLCRQCEFPWCDASCKFEAIQINAKTGIIEINQEKCTGCKACVKACPYDAMGFNVDSKCAFVCDLCAGEPQCIKSCRPGALRLIEYNDITI